MTKYIATWLNENELSGYKAQKTSQQLNTLGDAGDTKTGISIKAYWQHIKTGVCHVQRYNPALLATLCSLLLAGCMVNKTAEIPIRPTTLTTPSDFGLFTLTDDGPKIQSSSMSLAAALERAQSYSLRSEIAAGRVEEARLRILEAQSSYYPRLQTVIKTADWIGDRSGRIPRSFDEFAQAQLTFQYNLLDFGRTRHGIAAADGIYQSSQFNAQIEKNTIIFYTAKAYLDIRRYRLIQQFANSYVKETADLVDSLQVRVNGGMSPQSELIRGQLALTSALNRQKTIDLQLIKAKQQLITLLGMDVIVEMVDLPAMTEGIDFQQMIVNIQTHSPNIKAHQAEIDSAKAEVLSAEAARYPSVDITGAYKKPFQYPSGYSDNYLGGSVGLQVSMPILDGGVNSARIGQAKARLRIVNATYGQLLRDVNETSFNLMNDASNAKDMWKIQQQATQDASRTRDLYLDEFRLGNRSLNDLITVQADYFNAQLSTMSAQYDYYLSVLGLYLLSGQVSEGIKRLDLH